MASYDALIEKKSASAPGVFSTPGGPRHYPPDLGFEPFHTEIRLRIDLAEKSAAGDVIVSSRARRDGAHRLELDAVDFQDLSVSDPDGRAIDFSYDGSKIRVRWRDEAKEGDERRVKVSYSVNEPISGLFFSQPSGAYPDAGWWAATDHETERARYWLPCVDLPAVRTTLDFHLSAEERFTILANGALVGESIADDGWKTAHWKLEQRCPSYLVCFAIGDFTHCYDGEVDGIPIAYFCEKTWSEADLKRSFGRTGEMLRWMTKRLDQPYPFPKYYQFALPGIGGAMENISLVSWDDVFVLDEGMHSEWGWLVDKINLHEMAHTWFGDAVVCRDFAHAWLKESWAVYMEQVWHEETQGPDEGLYDFWVNANQYFDEADGAYMRPLVTRDFVSSWEMYDRHLYPGGACRLHTLRNEIGDKAFWASTHDYLKQNLWDTVETHDFRRLVEEHSGRSLVKFFDQWIYGSGYPDIKVTFSYDSDRKTGTFVVEQKQAKDNDKHPDKAVRPFDMKTDLGWTINGQTHSHSIEIDKARQSFTFDMAAEPTQVRFDPFCRVLHKLEFNPGDERLRNQISSAPDVIGRILAAYELAKTGTSQNINAILNAWRNEPFWGVRIEMAKAVTKAYRKTSVSVLASMIDEEKDPRVLEATFRAAGKFRDGEISQGLISRLARGLPPRAHAAALETLGAQREHAPWQQIVQGASREDKRGIVQGGAFRALAESRDIRAVDILHNAVTFGGAPQRARAAATTALGNLTAYLPRQRRSRSREALEDLLRDPSWVVRRTAVQALAASGEGEAVGAIAAYRSRVPLQEQVAVDKAIKRLNRASSEKMSSLESQVEKVQDEFRKLEERLQKLEDRNKTNGQSQS